MLLLVFIHALFGGLFFYTQAIVNGMAIKRWTFAGVIFGLVLWPMFIMNKRMKVNRKFGLEGLLLKA